VTTSSIDAVSGSITYCKNASFMIGDYCGHATYMSLSWGGFGYNSSTLKHTLSVAMRLEGVLSGYDIIFRQESDDPISCDYDDYLPLILNAYPNTECDTTNVTCHFEPV
jgi:hypothetical protein